MSFILVPVCVGVAVVALADAWNAERTLPKRVPMHFGMTGRPNQYGPRELLVGLFVVVIAGNVCLALAPTPPRIRPMLQVEGTAIVCVIAYVQHLVYRAARVADGTVPTGRVLLAVGIAIAAIAGATIFR